MYLLVNTSFDVFLYLTLIYPYTWYRWWEGLCWNKKLSFARDRLVESFMWAVGANYEPSYDVLRINVTKSISLVNVIDDIYDVYGTLDELEQFTEVVRRLIALI